MKLLNQFYICTPTHKKVILYHASSMTISIHRYSYASMYVCFFRFIYLFLHLFSHLFFVTLFYKKIAHHSTPHHTTPHHTTPHTTTCAYNSWVFYLLKEGKFKIENLKRSSTSNSKIRKNIKTMKTSKSQFFNEIGNE